MKIIFVIPGFGQGGAQRQCILLLNELATHNGLSIHLIYFYEGVYWSELQTNNIILHKGMCGSMWSVKALLHIYGVIREVKPNLTISWLHSCDVMVGIIKLICGKGFRWLMTERDSSYGAEFKYRLRAWIAKGADGVICNSRKGVSYWRAKNLSHDRVFLVDNIIYRRDYVGLAEKEIDFLYAGRLVEQKNIKLLCSILDKLAKLGYVCCVVGDGELEEHVRGYGSIRHVGFTKDIIDIYRTSRVFCSLSLHEGTPNTVIENIFIGNIVVLSDIQEHRDIVGGGYPFLCPLGQSADECLDVFISALRKSLDRDMSTLYQGACGKLEAMSPAIVAQSYLRIFGVN